MIFTGVFIGPSYEAYKHAKVHIINTAHSNIAFSVILMYIIYDVVAEITCKIKHVYLKNKYVFTQNYFWVKYISI
jgi:hypothetical protein